VKTADISLEDNYDRRKLGFWDFSTLKPEVKSVKDRGGSHKLGFFLGQDKFEKTELTMGLPDKRLNCLTFFCKKKKTHLQLSKQFLQYSTQRFQLS
jgi:hypothetical protein